MRLNNLSVRMAPSSHPCGPLTPRTLKNSVLFYCCLTEILLIPNVTAVSRLRPLGDSRKLCDLFIVGVRERKGKREGGEERERQRQETEGEKRERIPIINLGKKRPEIWCVSVHTFLN